MDPTLEGAHSALALSGASPAAKISLLRGRFPRLRLPRAVPSHHQPPSITTFSGEDSMCMSVRICCRLSNTASSLPVLICITRNTKRDATAARMCRSRVKAPASGACVSRLMFLIFVSRFLFPSPAPRPGLQSPIAHRPGPLRPGPLASDSRSQPASKRNTGVRNPKQPAQPRLWSFRILVRPFQARPAGSSHLLPLTAA